MTVDMSGKIEICPVPKIKLLIFFNILRERTLLINEEKLIFLESGFKTVFGRVYKFRIQLPERKSGIL